MDSSYTDAVTQRSVTETEGVSMEGSVLNLLLLFGSLVLQLPEIFGTLENEAIRRIAEELNKAWGSRLRPQQSPQSAEVFAVCQVEPSMDLAADLPAISGYILFSQSYPAGKLQAYFSLAGFPLCDDQPARAIHVHRYGDLSGSCLTAGPHYNPLNVNHPLHPGDFNNFPVRSGRIVQHLRELNASLYGPHSILGRGVVVHEKEDDLGLGGNEGSIQHGNSGRRLACCTIGISDGNLWKEMVRD